MRIKQLAKLHHKVCHTKKPCFTYEVEKEEKWVKAYASDILTAVCEECFGSPDRFVTSLDCVILEMSLPNVSVHWDPSWKKNQSNTII